MTLVILNGALIDGSRSAPAPNEALVVDGTRIRSLGRLPGDVDLRDARHVEVIDASARDNAFAVGIENEVGVLEAGTLAAIIVLTRDPLADVRVLAGGRHLAAIVKEGRVVSRGAAPAAEQPIAFNVPPA